ncbi:MAG: Polyhydroxyalkanoic acid synthase, partial [uncultured Nocardioides sp.]
GSDPHARSGRLRSGQRRTPRGLRRGGGPAPHAADDDRRRRPARGLPLPAGGARRGDRRPGPAGHSAGRAGAGLRPAPGVLAGAAPGRAGAPDVPGGVRTGLLRPRPRDRALGRGGGADRGARGLGPRGRKARARGGLEPRRHLRPAGRRRPAGPADRLHQCAGDAPGHHHGADHRAGASVARAAWSGEPGPRLPRLPGHRRCAAAAGAVGVRAHVVPEARHQTAHRGRPPRRPRLPGADRGRRPLHLPDDRLPGTHVRAALPPLPQGQQPRGRQHRARRPHRRALRDHRAGHRLRWRQRHHRPDRVGASRAAAADRCPRGAVRGRPRRTPRHADRARGARHDVAGAGRLARRVVVAAGGAAADRARAEGRRQEGSCEEGADEEGAHEAGRGPARPRAL